MALLGSLYLISTVAFCVLCLVIGARLLLLSRRTGGRPERLLGLGLGLTGGAGYGLLIAAALVRRSQPDLVHPLLTAMGVIGRGFHDIGVFAFLSFLLLVFRPGVAWARVMVGGMVATMAVGFTGYLLEGGFVHGRPEGFWYWLEWAPIGTYHFWGAAESFLYYGMMRRRRALGLADPIVVNRFLLWGVASVFAIGAIWTSSLLGMLDLTREEQWRLAPYTMSLTSFWGIGCISTYYLTFFPPAWYRARISAGAR
jgi:hypothetical protein